MIDGHRNRKPEAGNERSIWLHWNVETVYRGSELADVDECDFNGVFKSISKYIKNAFVD